METAVDQVNSVNVRANGILIVTHGHQIAPHPKSGCSTDTSTVTTNSATVKIGGQGVGRIGDTYGNNTITQGSTNVFSG
jgi:uncharacterized Zn-binding protein involved in type VI secretion